MRYWGAICSFSAVYTDQHQATTLSMETLPDTVFGKYVLHIADNTNNEYAKVWPLFKGVGEIVKSLRGMRPAVSIGVER